MVGGEDEGSCCRKREGVLRSSGVEYIPAIWGQVSVGIDRHIIVLAPLSAARLFKPALCDTERDRLTEEMNFELVFGLEEDDAAME